LEPTFRGCYEIATTLELIRFAGVWNANWLFVVSIIHFVNILSFLPGKSKLIKLLSSDVDDVPLGLYLIAANEKILFFHYIMLYGSYNWINLYYKSKAREETNSRLKKWLRALVIVDFTYITVAVLFALVTSIVIGVYATDETISNAIDYINYSDALRSWQYLGLFLSTLINGLIFSVACFVFGTTLTKIYYANSKSNWKLFYLPKFALFIAVAALLRIINDSFYYIKKSAYVAFEITSTCNDTFWWSGYLFTYLFLAEIAPASFFLIIFRPSQSNREALRSQLEDHSNLPNENLGGSINKIESIGSSIPVGVDSFYSNKQTG